MPLKLVTVLYQDVWLCDACIEVCNEILAEEGIATNAVPASSPVRIHAPRFQFRQHRCSFCGREEGQVMRLIALLHDLRICNLCVGACNVAVAMLNKEKTQLTEREHTVEQPSSSEPVTILHEIDLSRHTLFIMNNGSIDLVANDEHTAYLADNGMTLNSNEAYRLLVALHEHFKHGEASHQ